MIVEGDTGYFSGFEKIGERLGPFDLVAVPIGSYEPRAMMRELHMNPEEALRAATELRAVRAVAMHYGTFDIGETREFQGADTVITTIWPVLSCSDREEFLPV
jgi:L-ascorbate metabolism protein UlaG (beta-lactamase superfamily)